MIFTVLQSFTWDNIYRYDKEFRMHLSNFPQRNWGIILQQAWSVYLKDSIQRADDLSSRNASNGKKKEICKRFNKGKCTSGYRCQYDHRCLKCGKFGHGAHICRSKKFGDAAVSDKPEPDGNISTASKPDAGNRTTRVN